MDPGTGKGGDPFKCSGDESGVVSKQLGVTCFCKTGVVLGDGIGGPDIAETPNLGVVCFTGCDKMSTTLCLRGCLYVVTTGGEVPVTYKYTGKLPSHQKNAINTVHHYYSKTSYLM